MEYVESSPEEPEVTIEVAQGEPPPRTTPGGARPMAPDTQALHDACHGQPGEWFSIDVGSSSRATSRAKTLRKKGLETSIRGTRVYGRLGTDDGGDDGPGLVAA